MRATMVVTLLPAVAGQFTPAFEAYPSGLMVTATTSYGKVSGRYNRDGDVSRFFGIPYAANAAGSNRFKAPQPLSSWSGTLDCAKTVVCAQLNSAVVPWDPNSGGALPWSSENCLTLDIITPGAGPTGAPTVAPADTYPVQFWIYGGSMSFESFPDYQYKNDMYASGDPMYTYLPDMGKVVTVRTNYRTNWLGFFSHPSVAFGTSTGGSFGALDVIESLKFVNAEIKGFGGDPTKVTIQGESAGATLVSLVLSSPLSYSPVQLFRSAAAQSLWPIAGYGATFSPKIHYAAGDAVVGGMGCGGYDTSTTATAAELVNIAACMRSKPWAEVLAQPGFNMTAFEEVYGVGTWGFISMQGFQIYPYVDGYFMTQAPLDSFKSGVGANVNILIGQNTDEMSYMVPAFELPMGYVATAGLPPGDATGYMQNAGYNQAIYHPSMTTDVTLKEFMEMAYSVFTPYTDPATGTAYLNKMEYYYKDMTSVYQKCIQNNNDPQFAATHNTLFDTFSAQTGRTGGLYRYLFAEPGRDSMDIAAVLGVPHTAELNYVWGYYLMNRYFFADNFVFYPSSAMGLGPALGNPRQIHTYSAAQMALGNTMKAYWTAFINTGNPSVTGDGLPVWKGITTTEKHNMVFQSGVVPSGAQLDPCAVIVGCLAEPTADWRRSMTNFWKSGWTDLTPPATCSNPTVFNTTAAPDCPAAVVGSQCSSWCNSWTCGMGSCSGCSASLCPDPSTQCHSWCSAYTCGMAGCAGCSTCTQLASGSYCASWCNSYTSGFNVCKGCVG